MTVIRPISIRGRCAPLLSSAMLMLPQATQAQDGLSIPPVPMIVVPDFVGIGPAQQEFQDALGDTLAAIDGIRVTAARCDDQGRVLPGLGMVLREDSGLAADLDEKGRFVIEKGGAGVATVGGAQFTVEEDGSGTIRRDGKGGEQIVIEADGSGAYNGPVGRITLDGQGGGTWSSERSGQVIVEADGSGAWNGPLGQIVNEGDGRGSWNGEHSVINYGDGRGLVDGDEVAMEPLPPVPPVGTFPLLTKFQLPLAACGYLITLDDRILFDFDKSDLRPDAAETVDALALAFTKVAPERLEIRGHTDSKGSDDYNLDLSQRRAQTVLTALETREAPSLMEAEGFGESLPVAPSEIDGTDNPAGRQLNRRVEIFVPN